MNSILRIPTFIRKKNIVVFSLPVNGDMPIYNIHNIIDDFVQSIISITILLSS